MKKSEEKAAIALGRNRIIGSILLTILYWLALFGFWYVYLRLSGRSYNDPSCIIFTILLLVPFFKKVHKKWFETGYRGKVAHFRDVQEAIQSGRRLRYRTNLEMTVQTNSAGSVKETFVEGDRYQTANGYYHVDDEIWKIKGLPYPLNLTNWDTRTKDIFCPVCGRVTNNDKKRCRWCHLPLIK